MRLRDNNVVDGGGVAGTVLATSLALVSDLDYASYDGIKGNIFLWKNIDVSSFPTEYNLGTSDSII